MHLQGKCPSVCMTESLMKELEKPSHCTCSHTFPSLCRKHHHHHLFSPTHREDISSAHSVEKEPAGFPLCKITSCYIQGISQMAPPPSISQNIYPCYSHGGHTLVSKYYFSPPPASSKGGPFPQQMSKNIFEFRQKGELKKS